VERGLVAPPPKTPPPLGLSGLDRSPTPYFLCGPTPISIPE